MTAVASGALPGPIARDRLTLPGIAFATCVGYYVATLVGLHLRLPPATTSVMWPPNAVLASILILTPPRRWAVVLLCALPVHIYLQLPTGWPLPLILALYLTNCLEALLAAGGVHLLNDAPSRLDTLRRLAIFLFAVVCVAPVLSSFADAAAVSWFRGEPYWQVWRNRLLSNTLAELTVVPAVVGGVTVIRQWRRAGARARRIEAAILGLGVCVTGWLAFGHSTSWIPALGAVSTQTPLAVQLPLLLWATMRFGPAGTGVTLLTTSLLSTWAVVRGIGPFASLPAFATVPALSLSLIVVAMTLLCLATLIEERRQTQQALRTRLEFEGALARLSRELVEAPGDEMARALEPWLGRIGRVLGLDCVTVFVGDAASPVHPVHTWVDPRVNGPLAAVPDDHAAWARESLASGAAVVTPNIGGAASTCGVCTTGGAVSLGGDGNVLGALAFSSSGPEPWSDDVVTNMRLVGEVLSAALMRRRSEDALRTSEVTKSAILQSLTHGVAVLDRQGTVLQINARWTRCAKACAWMHAPVGENFLSGCWTAFEHGQPLAGDVVAGVFEVLEGTRDRFVVEHRTDSGASAEWWALTAVPLTRPEGGAVLTHADVTELRRAELEAQRSRQVLAQVSRVSTVVEMTAWLAHHLNQPLTAVMMNAQAALRMLDGPRADPAQVRAILADIVRDDRRAGEVMHRLRELLRHPDLEMRPVNLAAAIREVVDLVGGEAVVHNIALSVAFEHEPLFVTGDRVQLQQVVLNLLRNAIDALADATTGTRRIRVVCRPAGRDSVLVSVRDSGPGLNAGTEERIFEPFYTTKDGGMGVGLSIARSIVEGHDGTIRAGNDPAGGTVVEFMLPAAAAIAAGPEPPIDAERATDTSV